MVETTKCRGICQQIYAILSNARWASRSLWGRKTWESLGRPLPGRLNLVITRQADIALEGAEVFTDLQAAIQRGQAWGASEQGVDEVMVIGGGQLYQQALALTQRGGVFNPY